MSLASEQRQAVADLTRIANREVEGLFRLVEGASADQVRDALMDVLPVLGDQYGDAAAALAAEYYEGAREAAEARGAFSPILEGRPTPARWEALARWGVDPLFAAQPDPASALSLVQGGMQRTVADRHRLTIVRSSVEDPAAAGWRRVGVGDSCGFCRMLIDRRKDGGGGVYTEASVTFRSHDHCNCAAAPDFSSNVVRVSAEPFRQSKTNRSDATKKADNERARAYIADQYGN